MRCNVCFTFSFKRSLKRLKKKYPHVKEDIEEVVQLLVQFPDVGSSIPGYSHKIWKVRAKCRDIKKGKRAGYRVIYFWERGKEIIYLLFVYIKHEKADVSKDEIEKLLQDLQNDLESFELK